MVSTDGGMINPAGTTGTCCNPTDKAMVEEISAQLQERKVLRGNIGLMKMHSANGDKLVGIAKMVDALGAANRAEPGSRCTWTTFLRPTAGGDAIGKCRGQKRPVPRPKPSSVASKSTEPSRSQPWPMG